MAEVSEWLTDRIELMPSTEPAHWLRDRLAPWWRRGPVMYVGGYVPEGYDAYARIFHKAEIQAPDMSWEPVRWSELARANNRDVHPEMGFLGVAGLEMDEHRRGLREPFRWMDRVECSALMSVLGRFTTTPERCYFAVWHGYGGFLDEEHVERLVGKPAALRIGKAKVQLSFRGPDYLLLSGPLEAVMDFHGWIGGMWFEQTPDIWWPEDRAWCVSSDVDTMDTCLGGSQACIEAVLDAPELEVLPAQLTTVLNRPFG